jgi:hypothetical protein
MLDRVQLTQSLSLQSAVTLPVPADSSDGFPAVLLLVVLKKNSNLDPYQNGRDQSLQIAKLKIARL